MGDGNVSDNMMKSSDDQPDRSINVASTSVAQSDGASSCINRTLLVDADLTINDRLKLDVAMTSSSPQTPVCDDNLLSQRIANDRECVVYARKEHVLLAQGNHL